MRKVLSPTWETGNLGGAVPISPSIYGWLLQMAEEPPQGVTHSTALAHCHTTEDCYLWASHGALQKAVLVVWL